MNDSIPPAQHYPLPPAAANRRVAIEVSNVAQPLLFDAFAPALAALEPSLDQLIRGFVRLEESVDPAEGTTTWLVRWRDPAGTLGAEGALIGEIDADDHPHRGALNVIFSSGHVPIAHATFGLRAGSPAFDVFVSLPPAELTVPKNDPSESAFVLPLGPFAAVDTSRGDYSAADLRALGNGQWFFGLQPSADGAVVVTLSGRVLGPVVGDEAQRVREILDGVGADLEFLARGFVIEGSAFISVNDGGPEHLPPLDRTSANHASVSQPSTPDSGANGWTLQQYEDGSFAFTLSGTEAVGAPLPSPSQEEPGTAPDLNGKHRKG